MVARVNRYYFVPLLTSPTSTHNRLIFRTIARFAGGPPLEMKRGDGQEIRCQFFRFVRLEWTIVVAALACTALLTQLPPARHIRRHEHREQHAVHKPAQSAAIEMRAKGKVISKMALDSPHDPPYNSGLLPIQEGRERGRGRRCLVHDVRLRDGSKWPQQNLR